MKIEHITPKSIAITELGKRLTRIRKQRGMTQLQLAEKAGLGVATLRRIEDGRDAQIGSWFKLLQALNMASAVDALVPEQINSPMLEVKSARKKNTSSTNPGKWGDEAISS